MTVIAAIYFCSTPGTDAFTEAQSLLSKLYQQLGI
jgi:hypothetical protein